MSSSKYPITMGVRFLRERDIDIVPHVFTYEGGGARASAATLGVEPLRVAKTLLFENERAEPLVVVMNGPYEVAVKVLARELGTKRIEPCAPQRAEALTGYRVGGISPFGMRTELPTYLQLDLFDWETILVNGGKRGFLVELAPETIEQQLGAGIVDVAVKSRS
ncbi:YbaK/EbsC family protein [Haliangium ochraceum]|uniref:Cys-tRNA(Pro)/Cys-tRNA(Cys) deacylase n=1 Tax=Haliangium ochraceum (strain DSM 14365 / JCM 11303 / SMP-2) TaxID=502025 RepID=D0LFV0_HALO1|nr:YbaK/EbsC family protein [Haliangium ochraceum]ACY14552.1 YbaK/prolyl-tRNA synthetase associated region [Haliangium ochraceum DSM 14365]